MGSQDESSGGAKKSSRVVSVDSQVTVVQASETMREARVGCLVITDNEGKLAGIVSERDIVRCVVARGIDPSTLAIAEVMTADVACCAPDTSMTQARNIMSDRNIRHLPVVADGFPVGMVSSREVMSYQNAMTRGTRDITVFAMAKLAESRDSDTGLHLERVVKYATALAEELAGQSRFTDQLDDEFIRLLATTCPLHDIGKVAIPDHVLLKPGRLSDREFDIMKTHSLRGAETLDLALERYPEAGFLRMARDIACSHHERVDGDGYPFGIGGDEIPLAARIFSIADVYDALVTKRVYKGAFTHDVATNIIMEGKGTQFDADVVDGFTRCIDAFVEIQESTERAHAAA